MNYSYDFLKYRKIYFFLTLFIVVFSICLLFTRGLNLGIDFVSGTRLDITFEKKVKLDNVKDFFKNAGYKTQNIRLGGKKKDVVIIRLEKKLAKEEVEKLKKVMAKKFATKVSIQEHTVDPIIGRELVKNGLFSLVIALLGIVIYVSIRFEYRYAVAVILTLLYDAIFTLGMFSLLQKEVDLVFIAAILTIVGYSVNDTIVVFDRIRENMSFRKPANWETLCDVVNKSICQTLTRSLNTVLTVIFAALSLYFFGGESISNFSLALIFGIFSGAYSSIFVASQIWVIWKYRHMLKS